jgi:RimJ/RimL family protein N-acetyltransferase
MKRIRSPRLVLEPVTTENCAILWRLMQAAHLREFQDVPRHTREEFRRRVASRPTHFDARAIGRFEWLIVLGAGARAIGWISLRVGDRSRGTAEIGYSVLAGYRGEGYATEAARALVDHAFEDSDLRQIEACCLPANVASRRLLASVGFEERRIQRNGAMVRGRPVDIVLFELLRETWSATRRARQGGSANSTVIPASAKPK